MRSSLAYLLDDTGIWEAFWRMPQHGIVIGLRECGHETLIEYDAKEYASFYFYCCSFIFATSPHRQICI